MNVPVDIMECGGGPVEFLFEVRWLVIEEHCLTQFVGCIAGDGFGSNVQVMMVWQCDRGGLVLHLLELLCDKAISLCVELCCMRQGVAFLGIILVAFDMVQCVFQC